ncbi:unnamed protein product [Allacma fusca]|uniref:Large ribosomal subunit protein mL51 n=1 Tax=Allacma fusca TaxID=39272 RepID=A0A8J2L638_9HEXA|nr:unnamed protein product [Allacma fusca]
MYIITSHNVMSSSERSPRDIEKQSCGGHCGAFQKRIINKMFRNMMNSLVKSVDTLKIISKEFTVPVRYPHYYAKDKKPLVRRFGYKDKAIWRGALPRLNTGTRLPKPEYNPSNAWSDKKALFGQNDYIDILGNPKLHPVLISYNIPAWLRGFHGNEYQMLQRKKAFFGQQIASSNHTAYMQMWKRIRHQYKFLNWSKPQNRMPKQYYRDMRNK